jgi:hypothetical protein
MSNHKATAQQWTEVGAFASASRDCILELHDRVMALEAQGRNLKGSLTSSTPPPVATDEELDDTWHKTGNTPGNIFVSRRRALYDLGIKHGQARSQEVAEPAPVAGGLVARVSRVIGMGEGGDWSPEARAAIFEVVEWLHGQDWKADVGEAANLLEQEAGR